MNAELEAARRALLAACYSMHGQHFGTLFGSDGGSGERSWLSRRELCAVVQRLLPGVSSDAAVWGLVGRVHAHGSGSLVDVDDFVRVLSMPVAPQGSQAALAAASLQQQRQHQPPPSAPQRPPSPTADPAAAFPGSAARLYAPMVGVSTTSDADALALAPGDERFLWEARGAAAPLARSGVVIGARRGGAFAAPAPIADWPKVEPRVGTPQSPTERVHPPTQFSSYEPRAGDAGGGGEGALFADARGGAQLARVSASAPEPMQHQLASPEPPSPDPADVAQLSEQDSWFFEAYKKLQEVGRAPPPAAPAWAVRGG